MSPIWAVQGLRGWEKRVLWQMQMGLGLWNSCGGQISDLEQWGNRQARVLAPSNGPGHTRAVNRRQRRSPIWAMQGCWGG